MFWKDKIWEEANVFLMYYFVSFVVCLFFHLFITRNPDGNHRPTFKDILDTLAEDPEGLLHWNDENKAVHLSSSVLGSDLEAGQDLYPELQQIFMKSKLKI